MQTIPLRAIPAQQVQSILNQQAAVITLRQLSTGLYINLALGAQEVVGLVICENLNLIVRDKYLGFVGDLLFNDTQGSDDPDFTGLDSRFQLIYVAPGELRPGLPP